MRQHKYTVLSASRNPFSVTEKTIINRLLQKSRPIPKEHHFFRCTFESFGATCTTEIEIAKDSEVHCIGVGEFPVLLELNRRHGKVHAIDCFVVLPEVQDAWPVPASVIADAVRDRQISRLVLQ